MSMPQDWWLGNLGVGLYPAVDVFFLIHDDDKDDNISHKQ